VGVGEQPQRIVEECAFPGVVFVVLAEAVLDISEARTDAVLVPLQFNVGRSMASAKCAASSLSLSSSSLARWAVRSANS